MSIRIKIPLIILIAFIINIAIIGLYYRVSLSGEIFEKISEGQTKIDKLTKTISNNVNNKEYNEAIGLLTNYADTLNASAELSNLEGKIVFRYKKSHAGSEFFMSTHPVIIEGKNYLLSIRKLIKIKNLYGVDIVWQVIELEIILLFIILLFIALSIHFLYVRPLVKLSRRMNREDEPLISSPKPILGNDEIRMLESSFRSLLKKLDNEKQTQNRIIASISHDIKTPLTSVMGYAERLVKKALGPEKSSLYINTIYNKASDMSEIIDEFDSYISNKLNASLDFRLCSVDFIMKLIKEDYQNDLSEKNIGLKVINYCNENTGLNIDTGKFRRVISNIINNSIRHSNASKLELLVVASEDRTKVYLDISDNGRGVNESELETIFEPLFTSDKSRKVSGLGLSICQDIISSHQGKISAYNKKPEGFTIKITLPKQKYH